MITTETVTGRADAGPDRTTETAAAGAGGQEPGTRSDRETETSAGRAVFGREIGAAERLVSLARHWLAMPGRVDVISPRGLMMHLRDPRGESLREHVHHVKGIEWLPEGDERGWIAAVAAAVHLMVTVPVKAAGKLLDRAGRVISHAGRTADWAADRLLRLVMLAGVAAVIAVLAWNLLP